MKTSRRILFICYADSIHAQAWIRLLKDTPFDVRVFTSPMGPLEPLPDWIFPTYSVVQPAMRPDMPKTWWLLPAPTRLGRKLISRLERERLKLSVRWLKWIIKTWNPHIIHTLRLSEEGRLTLNALEGLPKEKRPFWIVSAWGVDMRWHIQQPQYRDRLLQILDNCDGFSADCLTDINIAIGNGLNSEKVIPGSPIPGTGGLELSAFTNARQEAPPSGRRIILVPKAMETFHLKTFTVIEGLRIAQQAGYLENVNIWFLMIGPAVREWLQLMPKSFQNLCACFDAVPHEQVLGMMKQARLMIAPTLVDGSPNVMWEAMAAGALPILSPIESIQEVIRDGENGLLVSALSSDQIAQAVIRGMTDDNLVERAAIINWIEVQKRADRNHFKQFLLNYYHQIPLPRL